MHGIGFWHENGQTEKVEYREDQYVRDIDSSNEENEQTQNMNLIDAEEEKKQSYEGSSAQLPDAPSDQTNDEVQLYRVHTKYDIVDTEIKLLYYGKYLHLMVRPFK